MEKFKFLTKNKISKLPKTPGVYAFKKGAKLLYIGKAANLKERAKQHQDVLSRAKHIAYIKTGSEIEALLLEARLIKKYQPKYNVVWRDDKNYFYICITKEEFPQVFITHQTKCNEKCSRYIGPFVDGKALKQTLKVLRKVFPYRSCKTLPKRPCLWYQLDRCPAPCLLKSKVAEQIPTAKARMKKECQRDTKSLIKILQGKKELTLKNLEKEMKSLSKEKRFEAAAETRDQIRALERVLAHAKIFETIEIKPQPGWDYQRIEAYDISNIQGKEAAGSMVVFINGKPDKSQYRKFKIKISGRPNDVAMIKEVLARRFKHQEWPYPDLILIDGGIAQLNTALKIKNHWTQRGLPGGLQSNLKNKIKVMSLAKKKNELYIENRRKPILLKSLPREIFNLILQLRDEAHRFARKYHHKLRERSLID